MKILIVSDAWEPQINGVVRTYQHIIEHLKAQGHEVVVIGPDRFISLPMPMYSEIRLALFPYRKLKKMISAFCPDTIHIAVEGPLGWATRRYCRRRKIPFTTSYHTMFPDYVSKRVQWMGRRVAWIVRMLAIAHVRRFHRASAATFVATQSLEDQLRRWRFKGRMVRLSRGVDLDLFRPGEKTLFKDKPDPIMLYVGRVAVEKNIEAFLSMDIPGTKVVVGAGPSLSRLSRQYPDVVFAGVQQGGDLAAHFRSADVFVFPSRTDTFGIVLIEALASGLPVAGYNVTGPVDIITSPDLGAVDRDLKVATEQALASKATPEQRHQYVEEHYSWEKVSEVFLETLRIHDRDSHLVEIPDD